MLLVLPFRREEDRLRGSCLFHWSRRCFVVVFPRNGMKPSAAQLDIGTLIERTPGIKGGTPHIAGTGVTIRTVARWYKLGLSAEDIATEIPHVSLAQVYAALAYYHANRAEMEAEMAAEQAESDKIEQEHLRKKTIAA